jgi:hypothetical protein
VLVLNDKKPSNQKALKPIAPKKNENNEEVAIATTAKDRDTKPVPLPVRKSSSAILWALLFIAVAFAGLSYWLFSKNKALEAALPKPPAPKTVNAGEKKLSDSLGLASSLFQLMPGSFGENVTISDTLFVRQDTLHINGNGIVLQRDSAYSGPAIKATANNKVLILENITFKDFATAVLLQGRGIQLRNVQFQNVDVPVQRQVMLPANQPVNGIFPDTVILKNDSLPTKQ